jgi:hypothetical protein
MALKHPNHTHVHGLCGEGVKPHDTRHADQTPAPGDSAGLREARCQINILEENFNRVLAPCCIELHAIARRLAGLDLDVHRH